jgi:hypothetical protein
MTATVQHAPKAGAKLTGTEYEAADHHTITGVALSDHTHTGVYAVTDHTHTGVYADASHTHAAYPTAAQVAALIALGV